MPLTPRKRKHLLTFFAGVIIIFWLAFSASAVFCALQKKYVYPVLYAEQIFAASKEYGIDAALLFAIVKTESGFDPAAVSNRGATGLMQISPATGDYIAKMRGIKDFDLKDPDTNIDFGGFYWKYLADKFGGLTETAAAYNAGEGNVYAWLNDPRFSADGITLSAIPYPETESYVKKIFKSLERYKKLYGNLLDK